MWKMSIQYMVLGFEPTTFGTWVSSHDHKTRAPAQMNKNLPNWWDKETDNVIKVWEGGRERGSMWKTREREWVRKWIREREDVRKCERQLWNVTRFFKWFLSLSISLSRSSSSKPFIKSVHFGLSYFSLFLSLYLFISFHSFYLYPSKLGWLVVVRT